MRKKQKKASASFLQGEFAKFHKIEARLAETEADALTHPVLEDNSGAGNAERRQMARMTEHTDKVLNGEEAPAVTQDVANSAAEIANKMRQMQKEEDEEKKQQKKASASLLQGEFAKFHEIEASLAKTEADALTHPVLEDNSGAGNAERRQMARMMEHTDKVLNGEEAPAVTQDVADSAAEIANKMRLMQKEEDEEKKQ